MRAIDLYAECISGEWKTEPKTDTQWALRRYGVSYILAFPPTQSDQDWRQNFRFWKSALPWKNKQTDPYKDMPHPWQAHAGFTEKYKAVRDEIMAELKSARPTQLYVTGYSQGGALATLAYEDIMFNLAWISPRMYLHGTVFGSPRVVGWKAPTVRWEGLVRYECSGDPVAWVPPFLFGYRHVGECYRLGFRCFPNPMRHAAYGVELSGAVGGLVAVSVGVMVPLILAVLFMVWGVALDLVGRKTDDQVILAVVFAVWAAIRAGKG